MSAPKYQSITEKKMGKYFLPDKQGEITVYAGSVFGIKGPASTFSPINIYKVDLRQDAVVELEESANFNTGMLVIDRSVNINENDLVHKDFVLLKNAEGILRLTGLSEKSSVMIFSGEPLNEPISAAGPFVMNTFDEIVQAKYDFATGKFGNKYF